MEASMSQKHGAHIRKAPGSLKEILGLEIVTIKFGKNLESFAIHKTLLCHHSPYFNAAFTSGFEETKTGIMTLPETEVETFQLFYDWVYRGIIWNRNDHKSKWPTFKLLTRLYVLADMTLVIRLKNLAIDTLMDLSTLQMIVPVSLAHFVWENALEESPLRLLMTDWVVWDLKPEYIFSQSHSLPDEFRLACKVASRQALASMSGPGCYHNPLRDRKNYHERKTIVRGR